MGRCRCRITRPGSGGNGGRLSGRPSWSSVGYMDPGNWGTDLAGGAQFKYGLLWVVALASFMAVILQVIAARLGIATGKDLAQCCRDWLSQVDPLAELGFDGIGRGGDRSGGVVGQRGGAEPVVPHSLDLGDGHHGLRRAVVAGIARVGHEDARGSGGGLCRDHRRLLWHRDFRPAADAAGFPGDGPGTGAARLRPDRACWSSPSASSAPP